MKVNNVHILNWRAPGAEWWEKTKEENTTVLARVDFEFTHREYRRFLDYIREKEKDEEYNA